MPEESHANKEFDHRLFLVEEAIEAHGSYIDFYCRGLTKSQQDAEELASDLWVHVLHRFKKEDIDKLGYLRRKAWQLWVDRLRKRARDPLAASEEIVEIPVSGIFSEPATPEQEAEFRAKFFAEHPEVELTEQQQEALWLHCREGRTFVEIGEIMEKSQSTIGDWIKAARNAFAEAYNKR